MTVPPITTQCVVVGGGPAGMMLSLLLARQGIRVTVLEKHKDFLRDFRGDTIHPSTQQIVHELGWLAEFHRLPHAKMEKVTLGMGGQPITFADFSRLPVAAPYIAFMPQWDFLDFLADKASGYDGFQLIRPAAVTELITEDGRVVGVRATTPDGELEARGDLIVGTDGRDSTVRERAGLAPAASAPPLDVLWFRLSRKPGEKMDFFRGGKGSIVAIDRGDFWQVAYTVPPGGHAELQKDGIEELRDRVAALLPEVSDRVDELASFDDVHNLSVTVDRLRTWHRPGLQCIGDAAHAMSPAGGVGINLAIQDAVATANILGPVIKNGRPGIDDLAAVQRRREFPTKVTQAFQLRVLKNLYPKDLDDDTTEHVPPIMQAFRRIPALRHVTGRFLGLGVRPEHVAH